MYYEEGVPSWSPDFTNIPLGHVEYEELMVVFQLDLIQVLTQDPFGL